MPPTQMKPWYNPLFSLQSPPPYAIPSEVTERLVESRVKFDEAVKELPLEDQVFYKHVSGSIRSQLVCFMRSMYTPPASLLLNSHPLFLA